MLRSFKTTLIGQKLALLFPFYGYGVEAEKRETNKGSHLQLPNVFIPEVSVEPKTFKFLVHSKD